MTVGQIDVHVLSDILKDDAGIERDTGEKGTFLPCVFTVVSMHAGLTESVLAFYDVMVPVDDIHTPCGIETGKHRKRYRRGFPLIFRKQRFSHNSSPSPSSR